MVIEKQPEIIIIQPLIPSYRVGFFKRLYRVYGDRLTVYTSSHKLGVLTEDIQYCAWQETLGCLRSLVFGTEWQAGVFGVPIRRNDIVVLWGAPRTISNIILLIKARLKGAKTIWWGHYWSSTSRAWRAWIRLYIMRIADCALFYTDLEVKEFYDRFGEIPAFPVFSLNNGLDNSTILKVRRKYNAQERGQHILFIGRLTAKSNFGLLLEALSNQGLQKVVIEVIGDGPNMEDFQFRALSLDVCNQVVWHGGFTDELRISEIANKCSLFVYPGAVGLSIIHALNYGLPVIVHENRREHMPEVAALSPGVNGFTFKQHDSDSLANVIVGALSNESLLDKMSEAAVATTDKTFNADDMAERFCAIVEAIK